MDNVFMLFIAPSFSDKVQRLLDITRQRCAKKLTMKWAAKGTSLI